MNDEGRQNFQNREEVVFLNQNKNHVTLTFMFVYLGKS
jgi:hypothetical protein